ncbi:MAG: hypothetical protein MJ002_00155 [Paludibacteraceae bacterium]|nr:hypothetical protein [Paludibacteraceae bacterium]
MKKLFLVLFCMLSVSAMACNKKEAKTEEKLSETLPTTSWFSNQFKVFWADFVYEVNQSGKSLKKFKPSAELVDFYALPKDKKGYVLTGYIQTLGKNFDADAVRSTGVVINEMIKDVYSFRCPLYLLPEFIKTAGVKSFEAGKKLERLHK